MPDHETGGPAAPRPAPGPEAPPPGGRGADEALRGIGLLLLGYGIVTFSDAAVKWVLPEIGVAVAMILRGLIGAAAVLAFAGGPGMWAAMRPVNRRLLVWRSLLHCLVTVTFYLAWLRGMALGDSYAVAAVSPLVLTLLAIPLLGEQVGWRRLLSTFVGFLGVLLMVRPGGDLWRWEAGLLLAGVGLMALTRLWLRVLARTDRPAAVTFWLMVAHVPVGVAVLPLFPPLGWPSWGGVLAILALGLGNASAHLLFARAFALAPVGLLAPFEYTTLVTGTVLGVIVWGDVPAWTTVSGAAVVVLAGLYNLHRARMRARQARTGAGARDRAGDRG